MPQTPEPRAAPASDSPSVAASSATTEAASGPPAHPTRAPPSTSPYPPNPPTTSVSAVGQRSFIYPSFLARDPSPAKIPECLRSPESIRGAMPVQLAKYQMVLSFCLVALIRHELRRRASRLLHQSSKPARAPRGNAQPVFGLFVADHSSRPHTTARNWRRRRQTNSSPPSRLVETASER